MPAPHNTPNLPNAEPPGPHHRNGGQNHGNAPPGRQQNHNPPYKKRANINIATLNINGATAPTHNMNLTEKWSMINHTIRNHKIAILALQETHLDEARASDIHACFQKSFDLHYSSDPENPRATAGVAFLINKALIAPKNVKVVALIPGRATILTIEWAEAAKISLLNIYAPVDKPSQPGFWDQIERRRRRARLPRPDFVLGDFNVTEDPIDRSPPHLDDQAATDALRTIKHQWEIQDHWRHSYPNERRYTYRALRREGWIQSRLDRIYAARNHEPNLFEWNACPTATPTDHWMVSVKYAPSDAPDIGNGRWTWPLPSLNDESLLDKVAKRGLPLQEKLEKLDRGETNRHETNPQLLWDDYKKDIQKIAKSHTNKSRHRTTTMIKNLEQDIKNVAANPHFDESDELRAEEAFLENKLAHLLKILARSQKDEMKANLATHGEKLGGIWSAINKVKKPRDLIHRLKIPASNPIQYERASNRMAELAKQYHDNLQKQDIRDQSENERARDIEHALRDIPPQQLLENPERSLMNTPATEQHVESALRHAKNNTATGMDGCPYELWKALHQRHQETTAANKPSFNINKVLTRVFQDIQENGIEEESTFALGWMCPIYKKKDRTEISNYRPITLLNTDYKLLTKVLAHQLIDAIELMIHHDQTGFIPKRSIYNNIRLAQTILQYTELTEEDGAILALDQEKAYDKIRHDYLWATLERFHVPQTFINTVKTLYTHAHTHVAINGVLSSPFKITRGVRQGDPLSCALFNLAIEPLACTLRIDPTLSGITIPGIEEKIIVSMFADDTNLYLKKTDRVSHIQTILDEWCRASGAKFNQSKTEIIPFGSEAHRSQVIRSRKLHPQDPTPLDNEIKIAKDGDAVRSLGAWIGNKTNEIAPWEPILDNINRDLKIWGRSNPTIMGRKLIVQAIIGAYTQFLTKAQGMPPEIETALTKMTRDFIWEGHTPSRIALEHLQRPLNQGGLNLMNLRARNDAIELTWLRDYLDFSPSRPLWAKITDLIIDAAMPQGPTTSARINCFLQTWNPPQRGERANHLDPETARMLRAAQKYNVNFAAIRLTAHLKAQLPAWFHMGSEARPIRNNPAKCLITKHKTKTIADLIQTSARLRNQGREPPHRTSNFCRCPDCREDQENNCLTPHDCAQEALTRLNLIFPKLNPLLPDTRHGNLSLTPNRKSRNNAAKENQEAILFDPTMTNKNNLGECFRAFTDPEKLSKHPAQRNIAEGTNRRHDKIVVHTDGACYHNGKQNATCGAGVWFGPDDNRNRALRVPGDTQSNQVGELAATIIAIDATPHFAPLEIRTDSTYVINGLTTHLAKWEDLGWINIKNAPFFKKAVHLLKQRTAATYLKWIKGHSGILGNEESDALAKRGARKETPDELDLSIPKEYDLQGTKMSTITQTIAYQGIMNQKPPPNRTPTNANLNRTRAAIEAYCGTIETDETIWTSLRKKVLRTRVKQFLYKTMHQAYMVGPIWRHIPAYEHRHLCTTCFVEDTMEHILTECNALTRRKIWRLAQKTWPHSPDTWPNINLGTILGIGALALPGRRPNPHQGEQNPHPPPIAAPTLRLLQILLSEAAHLVWVLRCERVIHDKIFTDQEINTRWLRVINERLTTDRITAQKTKRSYLFTKLAKRTWKKVLKQSGTLPLNWFQKKEVLVGIVE